MVTNELATASAHHRAAADEAHGARKRLAAAEQLLRAKESEAEDIRSAYEALATEHRRAQVRALYRSCVGDDQCSHGKAPMCSTTQSYEHLPVAGND